MKVLIINVSCGSGSTGRICTDIASELEKHGHEVKIAYGRDEVASCFDKYAVKIGNKLEIYSHVIKSRLFDSAGFGSFRGTLLFIEWIKDFNPDIIHIHNIHGYYINIKVLFDYLRTCEKKIIWTLHDCWAFTGHSAYCDVIDCKKWIKGCNSCNLLDFYPKSIIDNSQKNWICKKNLFSQIPNMIIVTPSNWLKGLVEKSFLKDYKIKVINNGINLEQFYFKKSNLRVKYNISEKFIILGVSSVWNKMKGLYDFDKLSKMLDDQYQIVLIGISQKQKKSLSSNIICIDKTSNISELAEWYSTADVLLNLSYCENYPTINIESLACGTPVITYNTGGSPEIVKNYEGIIIDKGDINSLIDGIERMKNICPTIKFNKELHNVSTMVEQYIQLYESVI